MVLDPAAARARRRRARLLQRYLINPPLVLAVRLGRYPGHVLVETVGRRTGRTRRTIVGARREGRTLLVVAEHGPHAGWVANLIDRPAVRVLLDRRWYAATAALDPDTDPQQLLDGWNDPAHAKAVRAFGTDLAVVRLDLADEPGPGE